MIEKKVKSSVTAAHTNVPVCNTETKSATEHLAATTDIHEIKPGLCFCYIPWNRDAFLL